MTALILSKAAPWRYEIRFRWPDRTLYRERRLATSTANHHRRYEVRLGRDLFDDWTVAIRYGRVGQGGQERCYGSPEPELLRAIIRDRLRRRLSAPRRIGCPYRLTAFSEAPGFDASAWLPADILSHF